MLRFVLPAMLLAVSPVVLAADEEKNEKQDLVRVPDAHLREAVCRARRKPVPDGEMIPKEILTGLYFLDARDQDIADLTGLEHCINLGEARLLHNRIQNLEPLKHCRNLQSLDVSHNAVEDLTPLRGIGERLQYLNIENNRVRSLEGVEALTNLNCLYASGNEIEDLSPVSGLEKLYTLDVNHNRIQNIDPVASLPRIDTLGLAHNQIEDVSSLPACRSSVYTTYLHGNRITDLAPLVRLAQDDADGPKRFVRFWKLYLAGNPLSEEAQNVQIPKLRELGVRVNLTYDR